MTLKKTSNMVNILHTIQPHHKSYTNNIRHKQMTYPDLNSNNV